jgi:hypothetical protein
MLHFMMLINVNKIAFSGEFGSEPQNRFGGLLPPGPRGRDHAVPAAGKTAPPSFGTYPGRRLRGFYRTA